MVMGHFAHGLNIKCPNGLLFNAQRAEPNWAKAKEREKERGLREIETSLSPTQAQLQPLAHCLSIYHLSGAIVYKPT